MFVPYVELHAHSAFSFLDGASLPGELVAAAVELGHDVLGLTDHNSVSGSMEFAYAARGLGLRVIHGAEVDLTDGRHLTLLVEDASGWGNLCRIITRAHARTRDPRPPAYIDALDPLPAPGPPWPPAVDLDAILDHAEGLVCLTGCASRGVEDEPTARRLLQAFGPDRLRVELQRPFLSDDRARNRRREALARRLGVPCVATGNVHAHARARAPLQDALTAVRLHTTLDASEPRPRPGGSSARAVSGPRTSSATSRASSSMSRCSRKKPARPRASITRSSSSSRESASACSGEPP